MHPEVSRLYGGDEGAWDIAKKDPMAGEYDASTEDWLS